MSSTHASTPLDIMLYSIDKQGVESAAAGGVVVILFHWQ